MKNKIPRPFVKWAGGKRRLISQYESYFPKQYNKYIEPFVGGGAIFFHLLPEKGILMDINEELINCYEVIRNFVEELIVNLKKHINDKEYFYNIRALDRNEKIFPKMTNVEKASRTLFLNRTCFNGLYRVNSKGYFNTPFCQYKNPVICDEENLRACSKALKNVQIFSNSFEKCLDYAEKNDFVYLDPPYASIIPQGNYTAYTKDGFGEQDQLKLFKSFKKLDEIGCYVMLSNAYAPFILDLYKDYHIITTYARRNINSNGEKRGKIKEVLILNNCS